MQFTLHGLDIHSTVRALDSGHREANPLFKDGSAGTMSGATMASSAVSIVVAEKLWKKNRIAAVLMLASINAGLSAVVANNYRLAATPGRRSVSTYDVPVVTPRNSARWARNHSYVD